MWQNWAPSVFAILVWESFPEVHQALIYVLPDNLSFAHSGFFSF